MRRVKVKQLRSDLSNQLKQLPFIITKHGDDIAIVGKIEGEGGFDKLMHEGKEVVTEGTSGAPLRGCKHGLDPKLCKDSKCRKKR